MSLQTSMTHTRGLWVPVAVGLLALLLAPPASAQSPFCAVRLRVDLAGGGAITSASAELRDATGKAVQMQAVKDGRAEFCDFGFGPHSIRVRLDSTECAVVTIEGIRIAYGRTQTLNVILNPCARGGDAILFGDGCSAFFRVRDKAGAPVPDASIYEGGVRQHETSDIYGRVLLSVPTLATEVEVRKDGYLAARALVECSRRGERRELEVVLAPTPRDR